MARLGPGPIATNMILARIVLTGVVQGVGFRPFVYRVAQELQLAGQVANTTAGVEIDVQGAAPAVDEFLSRLKSESPPLAVIDTVTVEKG
jgi:hydrogenase maturation protein HypF